MPRYRSSALALTLSLAFAPMQSAAAQTAPPPGQACAAPQYHQFDFWIGQWDVTLPNGKRAGDNRIEPILGGCALRESWIGRRAAATARATTPATRAAGAGTRPGWTTRAACWCSRAPSPTGSMVLEGETVDSAGKKQRQRITWQQTSPGHVRQLWESSSDGGGDLDHRLRRPLREALTPAAGACASGGGTVPFQGYRHPFRGPKPSRSCPRFQPACAPPWATATCIEEEIGRGGAATVYLAEDLKHARKVAIKVLRPDTPAGGYEPQRFLREIRIAARLAHPQILPLHDSGECERAALLRDALRRLREPARPAGPRGSAAGGRRAPDHPRGRRRAGVRPPARRHPPRHQAREHPAPGRRAGRRRLRRGHRHLGGRRRQRVHHRPRLRRRDARPT